MKESKPAVVDGIAGHNRCRSCVLPKSLGMVFFDTEGTCRLCRESDDKAKSSIHNTYNSERLDEEIGRIRQLGVGRPYDAVVGLSGGRDSSYMTYLLAHRHNLRLLGAYYRTPFTPEISDANVRRLVQHLDIPLVKMSVSLKSHTEAARGYFLRWYKNPRPEYAALCCAGCKLIFRDVYRIARQYDIKSIVFGGSPLENVPFLPTSQKTSSKSHCHSFGPQFRKMTRIFSKGLRILFQCPPGLLPLSIGAALLYLNPHTPYLRFRYPNTHCLDYFHYAPWVESDCVETIQTQLGWQSSPDAVDTWKSDCDFANLKNYMFYKMYGATYNDALYSNLIRDGQMTRGEAISRIQAGAGLSVERINKAMQTMRLSMDMIDCGVIEKAREIG